MGFMCSSGSGYSKEPSQRDSSFEHPKYTVKPVNNDQQKIDKTKILMTCIKQ